jgi:hypothetical protein
MQRAPEKLKSQLRDFRSDGEHVDASLISLCPERGDGILSIQRHYTRDAGMARRALF